MSDFGTAASFAELRLALFRRRPRVLGAVEFLQEQGEAKRRLLAEFGAADDQIEKYLALHHADVLVAAERVNCATSPDFLCAAARLIQAEVDKT